MRDADGHDTEGPKREALAWEDLDELGFIEKAMLFELAFDIGKGELGTVDGHVELGQDPGKAANVIFVAVGEHDRAHFGAVFEEIADVGDDDIHAEELFFGKHEAGVDHKNIVAKAEGHAVHAELAQAAQWYDLEFI